MNVYVIHGSPLSGKSTYVDNHKGPNDLIYDFDLIMSAISGLPIHQDNKTLISYVVDIRDLMLSRLKSEKNIDNAWIITTYVTEDLREQLIGLNPIYKEIRVSKGTALKRLKDNPNGRDIEEYTRVTNKYFNKFDAVNFYKTEEWVRKRIVILKRDGYQCMNCKRYGLVTEANTVHHIIPLEDDSDLRLHNNNLLSLCMSCHEKMHDKYSGRLSKLGQEWRTRTTRKYKDLE